MKKVLFPGSFDPITKGHMNIILQVCDLFDEVYIGVLQNSSKGCGFFTLEERINLIQELYQNQKKIKIVTGVSTVDLALNNDCSYIIRGLRNTIDFEYEKNIAEINKDLSDHKINTICLFADQSFSNISSSSVREIFSLEKDISKYVDPVVNEKMLMKRK